MSCDIRLFIPQSILYPLKNYIFRSGSAGRHRMICRIPSGLRCVVDVARRALPFPDRFKLCGCILICRPAARSHSGGNAELRQQPGLEKNPHGNGNDQNPDGIHKHLSSCPLYQAPAPSAIISLAARRKAIDNYPKIKYPRSECLP